MAVVASVVSVGVVIALSFAIDIHVIEDDADDGRCDGIEFIACGSQGIFASFACAHDKDCTVDHFGELHGIGHWFYGRSIDHHDIELLFQLI